MNASEAQTRTLFDELQPGDRVRLEHEVKVGQKTWTSAVVGAVERKERRRHGLHYRRSVDDKVFSDVLVLRSDSGELTTVSIDEFTVLARA